MRFRSRLPDPRVRFTVHVVSLLSNAYIVRRWNERQRNDRRRAHALWVGSTFRERREFRETRDERRRSGIHRSSKRRYKSVSFCSARLAVLVLSLSSTRFRRFVRSHRGVFECPAARRRANATQTAKYRRGWVRARTLRHEAL